jgi:Spy/CpxP family protein refolding chaperone
MRYRNLLLSVFILCLTLAVTNLAGAQGTATSPSTPDTHTQSSPGAQPPSAPAPSTNNSGTQSAPGAQSTSPSPNQGTSSTGSANSGQSGQKSVEDELQLTPDQKQKIAEVVDDENKQITAVRNDTSLSMDQKQQKVLQIRQEGSPRIKAILTPEQLQKLAAIQQKMRDQQQGGQGQTPQQQSAPPSNPPQNTPPQNTPPQNTPPQK